MARLDNPFSLFEADDDELDPVAIHARVEAKKVSDSNAAPEKEPQLPEKKDDFGGRAERGRGGGRVGRGRGAGRAGGESWGQYGDGYTRVYGGDFDGRGGLGGRGGRGGPGRGRGRGYYEHRGAGNDWGEDQSGANRNQVQDGGGAEVVQGGEVQEAQGRGYYGNRRNMNFENRKFGDENQSSGWDAKGYYGDDGRRHGGRNGWYERSENRNEPPPKEEGDESRTQTDGNDAYSGSARDVSENAEAPKDSENEVPKNADDEKANNETTAPEDVSEKKNAEDDTMTLEEYEKLLFEKRKALEALKTEERKVDIDIHKNFGGMTLIEKKKDEGIFIQLKSDKDKLKKVTLEKEEKARKAMSINEFLKPGEGETYKGPSYARERAARIRLERLAREDEEFRHDVATAEEGADAPAAPSGYGGRGRGRGRGRGQRGGFRRSNDVGSFSRNEQDDAFQGGVPNGESDKEFLDKEFPVLGGVVKV